MLKLIRVNFTHPIVFRRNGKSEAVTQLDAREYEFEKTDWGVMVRGGGLDCMRWVPISMCVLDYEEVHMPHDEAPLVEYAPEESSRNDWRTPSQPPKKHKKRNKRR